MRLFHKSNVPTLPYARQTSRGAINEEYDMTVLLSVLLAVATLLLVLALALLVFVARVNIGIRMNIRALREDLAKGGGSLPTAYVLSRLDNLERDL